MTDDQRAQCHAIIHTASAAAAGVGGGLAQIPLADNAVITPIQLTMTLSLGKVFGVTLGESAARAALTAAATSIIGRTIARSATQMLVGWIPGIGNAVNATTAAGVTEVLGWTIADDFDRGLYR